MFEDCLHKEEGETKRDIKKKGKSVYSALHKVVGLPQRRETDLSTIISLLRIYAKAREHEILCFAINAEEPPLPTTALNALLLMLMDKFIVFECTGKAIRTSRDALPFGKRLEERSSAIQRVIEDVKKDIRENESTFIKSVVMSNTQETVKKVAQPGMWTHVGVSIPSDELNSSYPKPWFAEEWLRRHVPRESCPELVKRVMLQRNEATDLKPQLTGTENLGSKSVQIQRAEELTDLGTDSSNKRKRKEDEDISPDNRGKAVKAEVGMENAYYTIANLVYRPKA